ncbi:MAG: sulfur oxidation c-type cytochrome SoxX, partial [Rhodospirillaceae bacterium]
PPLPRLPCQDKPRQAQPILAMPRHACRAKPRQTRPRPAAPCLACHAMPIPEHPSHGDLGPDLAGVGAKFSVAELRLRLVDPAFLKADTIMPAYYKTDGRTQVLERFRDSPILSAQEVEDVLAYLQSLK